MLVSHWELAIKKFFWLSPLLFFLITFRLIFCFLAKVKLSGKSMDKVINDTNLVFENIYNKLKAENQPKGDEKKGSSPLLSFRLFQHSIPMN